MAIRLNTNADVLILLITINRRKIKKLEAQIKKWEAQIEKEAQ